jgi:hypothetical protein
MLVLPLDGILRVSDAFAQTCGEPAAHAAMRAILIHTGCLGTDAEQARFDKIGWQKYIEEERVSGTVDLINQVSRWVEGAAYAAQGTVRLRSETSDIAEREKHVRQLIAFGEDAAGRAASLFSESSRRIWLGSGRARQSIAVVSSRPRGSFC